MKIIFFRKIEIYLQVLFVLKLKIKSFILVNEKKITNIYSVSSSEKGIGNKAGSNKTPIGIHRIKSKIGDNVPINSRFIGRKLTGEIIEVISDTSKGDLDIISTRIMWLSGEEYGINKGNGIDSYERYIYIHGTNEEGRIGIPSSHGCVRMKNKDVIDLYRKVEVGTLVLIK